MARRLIASPPLFDGTLAELFEGYIQKLLPPPEEVEWLHRLLVEHTRDATPVFVVRYLTRMERGRTYRTKAGDQLVPSDNAPAWWMHYLAFNAVRPRDLSAMPTHMFEVGRVAPVNISTAGWHVAHIYNAKDRNTDWQNWSRRELVKRFIRNVHPCNCFYVPKVGWKEHGGRPEVIAFFADVYAKRYASVWDEFVGLAEGSRLPTTAGSVAYAYAPEVVGVATASANANPESRRAVAASYRFSRLCFKADIIEPLHEDDVFEVVTPDGTYRMTKREFHRDFAGVLTTRSYSEGRIYHYPKVPKVALKYRVG